MTDDEAARVDLYLKLAEYAQKQDETRSSIEWKVTLAIWTILFATAGFFITYKISLPFWVGLSLSLPFVLFHFFWLNGHYEGGKFLKRRANFWIDKVQSIALDGNDDSIISVKFTSPDNRRGGLLVYILVTCALTLLVSTAPLMLVTK